MKQKPLKKSGLGLGLGLSWTDLREMLRNRFAEITDLQHALVVMRRTRQNSNESVQFAERMLHIAEDAYNREKLKDKVAQQQLVNIFCDGFTFDYLRMKILREIPEDVESAIQVPMREQNLRQRLAIRGLNAVDDTINDNRKIFPNFDTSHFYRDRLDNYTPIGTRRAEPMEVDHAPNDRCYKKESWP